MPVLCAPFVGSLLGVLIRRMPTERPVAMARSACEACGHRLAPWELVPVVSFVALRGRCRHCKAAIAPAHLWVELAAAAVAAMAVSVDTGAWAWAGCVLGWTLLALAWIDAEHFWLPDALTLPLVVAGLGVTWWLDPGAITDHAAAAALAYALLRGLMLAYRRWRGRDGLGQGDAKLLTAGGAWLGLAALPWVLFGGAVAGLLLALAMRRSGTRLHAATMLPFGPPLAVAIWGVWLFGL